MGLSLIIGLILVGIVLVLIEIFITPGLVVGIIGAIMIAAGIFYAYQDLGSTYGLVIMLVTLLMLGITIYRAFKNGAWNRFATKEVIDGKANNIHTLKIEIGDTGATLSALRPAGTVMINGQKLEVHTEGGFILANVEVEVVKRIGNRIFVKQITK